MVPEGWEKIRLDHHATHITSGSRGWAEYYSDEGDVFVRITNLRRGSIEPDWTKTKHVVLPDGMNEGLRTRLTSGDILISITADLGIIGYMSGEPAVPHYINQHVALVRLDKIQIDPQFVAYLLSSTDMRHTIQRLNDGGAKAGLSLPTIRGVPIKAPPLPEQRKIADILSTWDQAIEKTEALLTNARTQKRALTQQLLTGKRRYPEFEGQPWKEVRFEHVFERVKRKNTVGNDTVLTISAQHGLVSQEQYFNKRVAAKDLSGYTLLHQGDFAYNKSYSNGYPLGAIKMREVDEPGVVSSLYLCFSLIDDGVHSREFFRHFFEAGRFNHEIYKIAQEGARNHGLLNVSVTDFFRSWLRIPELDEQRLIARTIGTAETEEEVHRRELMRLRAEKKALMQQLLTGKRRVVV